MDFANRHRSEMPNTRIENINPDWAQINGAQFGHKEEVNAKRMCRTAEQYRQCDEDCVDSHGYAIASIANRRS